MCILLMYCKNCISFNFSILFVIYTIYRKKNLHALTAKKNSFFYNLHDLPQKKDKLHESTIFLYTRYIFYQVMKGYGGLQVVNFDKWLRRGVRKFAFELCRAVICCRVL